MTTTTTKVDNEYMYEVVLVCHGVCFYTTIKKRNCHQQQQQRLCSTRDNGTERERKKNEKKKINVNGQCNSKKLFD